MVNLKRNSNGQIPPLLHLTYDLQQLSDKNLMPKVGIGLGQVRILSGLHSLLPRSQRGLAVELRQTEANISRQLQVLKKAGLVTIARNKQDGRQRDIKLTSKGSKKLQLALKILENQQKELMKLVNQKERKDFEKSTGQMAAMLGVRDTGKRKHLS